jgi:hypothetical protein
VSTTIGGIPQTCAAALFHIEYNAKDSIVVQDRNGATSLKGRDAAPKNCGAPTA